MEGTTAMDGATAMVSMDSATETAIKGMMTM